MNKMNSDLEKIIIDNIIKYLQANAEMNYNNIARTFELKYNREIYEVRIKGFYIRRGSWDKDPVNGTGAYNNEGFTFNIDEMHISRITQDGDINCDDMVDAYNITDKVELEMNKD